MAAPASPFAFRDYRFLWAARFGSNIAQNAMVVVIGWQVYDIARATMAPRDAAFRLGLVGIVQFLPLAALTRGQFERLRSGSFHDVRIGWTGVWTMDDRLQPLFPVPACVVFGERRRSSKPLPRLAW